MRRAPKYDAAEFLDNPEMIVGYLDEAFASGEIELIVMAIGAVARAQGMSLIAREAGVSREHLYRALGSDGNPEIATVLKVLDALGVRLAAKAKVDDAALERT